MLYESAFAAVTRFLLPFQFFGKSCRLIKSTQVIEVQRVTINIASL